MIPESSDQLNIDSLNVMKGKVWKDMGKIIVGCWKNIGKILFS